MDKDELYIKLDEAVELLGVDKATLINDLDLFNDEEN